jgi:hypothetical protein
VKLCFPFLSNILSIMDCELSVFPCFGRFHEEKELRKRDIIYQKTLEEKGV